MIEYQISKWAAQSSPVHRLHPVAKLVCLLILLIAVAFQPVREFVGLAPLLAALVAIAEYSKLPLPALAVRAALVLVFTLPFLFAMLLSGDRGAVLSILARTYTSALAITIFAATTPVTDTVYALRRIRVPPYITELIQFIYRYLFVIAGQYRAMQLAAAVRGGRARSFTSAALARLFARSYYRAENVHRAMLSRGYSGTMPHFQDRRWNVTDVFATVATVLLAAASKLLL